MGSLLDLAPRRGAGAQNGRRLRSEKGMAS